MRDIVLLQQRAYIATISQSLTDSRRCHSHWLY